MIRFERVCKLENKYLIEAKNLSIGFIDEDTKDLQNVVDNISFHLNQGEILGVVGESGSGKSMSALSIMGLLPKDAVTSGEIYFDDIELLDLDDESLRELKGKEMSMIFQEPMTSLNPSMTVGHQVEEMLIFHEPNLDDISRKEKTIDALREAGLKKGEEIYKKYPHELSGGMRQRVMIAMAMICRPRLLIADEPTTALDVTTQAKILELIKELNNSYGISVILISHDLSVVKKICSRVIVMEEGNIVEEGNIEDIFYSPKEDYTKDLLKAMPIIKLESRQGGDTKSTDDIFMHDLRPAKEDLVLDIQKVNVFYKERNGFFAKERKSHVVKDVSLNVKKGETLGLVGESGSGKSSLAKAILGIVEDYTGEIMFPNIKPQMVFQDPYTSLNPVKKVRWILEEPLKLQTKLNKTERREKVSQILKEVDLDEKYGDYYLSSLSGGQRQRVAIGASLIVNPEFIVLDEPVSALDVTVQHQIIDLLKRLKRQYNLSYLFISHDLNVIYQICDRVCVMYRGEIVESAKVDEIFNNPQNEYTKKLLKSVI